MSVRLGIVMDPIARINFKKDSSLAMLLAAQAAAGRCSTWNSRTSTRRPASRVDACAR